MNGTTSRYSCPAGYQLRNLGSYPTSGVPSGLPPGSTYLGQGFYCAPVDLYSPPPPPPIPQGQPPLPAGAQPAPERTNGNGGGGSCCNRCDGIPAPAGGAVASPGAPAAAVAVAAKGKLDSLPWWVWVLGLMATAGAVK